MSPLLPSWLTRHHRRAPFLVGLTAQRLPFHQLWRQVHAETTLEAAFTWLCAQPEDGVDKADLADYRRRWPSRRAALQRELQTETFRFQPVRRLWVRTDANGAGWHEVRAAEDRLVIHALAEVLRPLLTAVLSPACTHLRGAAGAREAAADLDAWMAEHPRHAVIRAGIEGGLAAIDHRILAEQLRHLLPHEPSLHKLLWQFIRRTVANGGSQAEIERGLPLSALLTAVYLSPLDALSAGIGFYRRDLETWVWAVPGRRAVDRSTKGQSAVLKALRVKIDWAKNSVSTIAKAPNPLGYGYARISEHRTTLNFRRWSELVTATAGVLVGLNCYAAGEGCATVDNWEVGEYDPLGRFRISHLCTCKDGEGKTLGTASFLYDGSPIFVDHPLWFLMSTSNYSAYQRIVYALQKQRVTSHKRARQWHFS